MYEELAGNGVVIHVSLLGILGLSRDYGDITYV
jgi:hypothetical protein